LAYVTTNGISIAVKACHYSTIKETFNFIKMLRKIKNGVYVKKFILVTIFSAVFLTLPATVAFYIIFDSLPVLMFNDIGLIAN
jgi:hypothetical protein